MTTPSSRVLAEDAKEGDQKTFEEAAPPLSISQSYDEIKPTLHWRTW